MTAESGVKWLLRFIAFTTLLAFVAAVMPQPWLASMIHKADPGVPMGILVTYLARGLMAMYAFAGLLCLVSSLDIKRYLPLIWILGAASSIGALVGLVALFCGVPPDHRIGFFWVVFADLAEGLAQGVLLLALLLHIPRRSPHG